MRSAPATAEQIGTDLEARYSTFVPNLNENLGATDSAHGVIFGEVPILGVATDVAIKPFTKFGKVNRERTNYERIAQRGISTLTPVDGFRGSHASYLLTMRRPGLLNEAQRPWHEALESDEHLATFFDILGSLAVDTAIVHDLGVSHGDYQAKNVSYDSGNGLFVVTDVERSQVGRRSDDHAIDTRKDISTLGASLLERGLFGQTDSATRVRMLDETLLEPYLASRTEQRSMPDGQVILGAWKERAEQPINPVAH